MNYKAVARNEEWDMNITMSMRYQQKSWVVTPWYDWVRRITEREGGGGLFKRVTQTEPRKLTRLRRNQQIPVVQQKQIAAEQAAWRTK